MIISVFIFRDFGESSSIVITHSPKCIRTRFCLANLSCPFSTCWVADLLQKRCWQWEEQQETWHVTAEAEVPQTMDGWNSLDSPWKTWRENMESIQQTHMWKSRFASHLSVQVLKFHDKYYKSLQVRFFGTLQQNPKATSGWISKLFGS